MATPYDEKDKIKRMPGTKEAPGFMNALMGAIKTSFRNAPDAHPDYQPYAPVNPAAVTPTVPNDNPAALPATPVEEEVMGPPDSFAYNVPGAENNFPPRGLPTTQNTQGQEFALPAGIQRDRTDPNSFTGTSAGQPQYGGKPNPANPFGRSDETQAAIEANVAGYERGYQALRALSDARTGRQADGWIPGSSRSISEAERQGNKEYRNLMGLFEKEMDGGSRKKAQVYLRAAEQAKQGGVKRDTLNQEGEQFAAEQAQEQGQFIAGQQELAKDRGIQQDQFGIEQQRLARGQEIDLLTSKGNKSQSSIADINKLDKDYAEFAETFAPHVPDTQGRTLPESAITFAAEYPQIDARGVRQLYQTLRANNQMDEDTLQNPKQVGQLIDEMGDYLAKRYGGKAQK